MFRKRDPQRDLFESSMLVPPEKAERLRKSWAETFLTKALPLIDEETFAPMYHPDNGRPNVPVKIVLGVLILKEMHNLTDEEALEQLEYSLLWHHALALTPEEAHLCQKTLHNFRVRLLKHDGGKLVFRQVTDRIIEALGLKTGRQRLDSTHIYSNFATLTRLGLFCETNRVFLVALRRQHPRLFAQVSESLRGRYLKEDGSASAYKDVRTDKARRRLLVCARDTWRLVDHFRDHKAVKALDEYALLERLLGEQCKITGKEKRPFRDDDDFDDGGTPVKLKKPKDVPSSSLQTPHDPDVTYSGHKGKGYEVQVAETCDEQNSVEIITHVEVTPSCGSDTHATVPTLLALAERGLQPEELFADTTYGAAENCIAAECMGTEVISPVGGTAPEEAPPDDAAPLAKEHFRIDASHAVPAVCPAGHQSIRVIGDANTPNRVAVSFDEATCEACPQLWRCPVKADTNGSYTVTVNLKEANLARRREAEASGEFAPRYAIRAGIEATNSELKRPHGLGKLRVRRKPRVELAVYLKALACNIKRMVRVLSAESVAVAA